MEIWGNCRVFVVDGKDQLGWEKMKVRLSLESTSLVVGESWWIRITFLKMFICRV